MPYQHAERIVSEALETATAPEAALHALARHDEALRHREDDFVSRHFLLWEESELMAKVAVRLPLGQNTHSVFGDLSVLACVC